MNADTDSTGPEAPTNEVVIADPWLEIKQFTQARIRLGRCGASIPTQHVLAFQLAHAQAQDAVQAPLDVPLLLNSLATAGIPGTENALILHSKASTRTEYLQRPDFGRQLDHASCQKILDRKASAYDLAIVMVDGLSAQAVQAHATSYLSALLAQLVGTDSAESWSIAPWVVVQQGRVAIGDEIGAALKANLVLVLIGERPGLSSPDSLGIYLTWQPKPGRTDAERNCISNVRPAGMSFADAAQKTRYLLVESRARQVSGIGLKEAADTMPSSSATGWGNFLSDK